MLGYVTIGTSDLDKATAFYDALLQSVGGKMLMGSDRIKFFGTESGGAMLAVCEPYNKEEHSAGNGNMVAIPCGSPEDADAMYARAIELGATCDGPPGQRIPIFYGGYVRDHDNNKLAFYHMTKP